MNAWVLLLYGIRGHTPAGFLRSSDNRCDGSQPESESGSTVDMLAMLLREAEVESRLVLGTWQYWNEVCRRLAEPRPLVALNSPSIDLSLLVCRLISRKNNCYGLCGSTSVRHFVNHGMSHSTMVRGAIIVAVLAQTAFALSGTHPIVAWSSHRFVSSLPRDGQLSNLGTATARVS